jgi:flagellar motor switch protein FliG
LDFDDLLALDDAALARVFRAADPQVALLALTGASPQMADRMLGQLAPREATGLARQMEALGPIRLQDVACAQQQLADLAWQLAKQGVISLPPARYLMEAV